ncbi:hypothetical protein LTR95_010042 [Oleoguttula sp. CCFEE 5521]
MAANLDKVPRLHSELTQAAGEDVVAVNCKGAETWVALPRECDERGFTTVPGIFALQGSVNQIARKIPASQIFRYTPAKLCPLFQGGESSLWRYGPPPIDAIILRRFGREIVTSIDFTTLGSWCGIQITDPPSTRAEVRVQYNLNDDRGLTLGALFDGLLKHAGELDKYHENYENSTLHCWRWYASPSEKLAANEFQKQGTDYTGVFGIDERSISIALSDVVVPSDAEWQEVHDRAAQSSGTNANTAVFGT